MNASANSGRLTQPYPVFGLLLLLVSVLLIAAAPPTRPNIVDGIIGDQDPTPEVSTAELRRAVAELGAIVLDARPYEEYAVSHLPAARSVKGKVGTTPALYVADVNDVLQQVPDKKQPLILYCNGLFCGRSKRFAAELVQAGYTNVRRYQLGIPAWRALGGVTQVEKDALMSLLARDQTAVLVDAREPGQRRPRLLGATPIPLSETTQAKDDGRLPMTDHNTRIFVVGSSGTQARAVAEAIVKDAFHNVAFFDGPETELPRLLDRHR
ncbi:MAG TPA: rhodanese-like domain-containing protein [Polyangiaceae bacterium]|nr:rhodanese-like domain-containing protein [Polyangiaceae bacterium]